MKNINLIQGFSEGFSDNIDSGKRLHHKTDFKKMNIYIRVHPLTENHYQKIQFRRFQN